MAEASPTSDRARLLGLARARRYADKYRLCGIYCIRHIQSGMCYVGSSVNIPARWRAHKSLLSKGCHHSIHLQRSWAKYGPDAFQFEVVLLADQDELQIREQQYIDIMLHQGKLLNSALEVDVPPWRGRVGDLHPGAKLSEADVFAVFAGLLLGESFFLLAEKFSVSPELIRALYYGRAWTHLPRPIFPPRKRKPRFVNYKGSLVHTARMTDDVVKSIKDGFSADGAGYAYRYSVGIAPKFGVSPHTIYDILCGRTWKHV